MQVEIKVDSLLSFHGFISQPERDIVAIFFYRLFNVLFNIGHDPIVDVRLRFSNVLQMVMLVVYRSTDCVVNVTRSGISEHTHKVDYLCWFGPVRIGSVD